MIIKFFCYVSLIFFACFFTAMSVSVGVLTALKAFWKKDLGNGVELIIILSSAITLAKEQKEKEGKDADKTGRIDTDR